MALLGFANNKFIGGIQSNSQQPITTTIKATDLKTGKTQTIDLKVADKESVLSTTVDQSNDGRIFFVTSQNAYSQGQTRWTFSIKAIDLYTGELLTVLESSQNYSQNQEPINPYQQIGTDLLGNLYVLNKTTSGTALKVVASDTKNKAILSGNELTKQLNSFYASDAKVVNGVTLQDKPKQYTLSSFYASPDGSFYVLGKNSSYKQDRLFQVLLSTETSSADTQPDGKPIPKYSFTPVTSGVYKVENVVALNNANALVQIGNDWKAYQSSTGTPNTYIDNLLSLDYNSPFQLKTVKTSKQFIPSGTNISGNYGLDISYFDPDGRQQISNLTSLLPMQPGAARSQIAGTQNKAMQVGDLTASLVEIGGSNPVLQLGALSQQNMIVDQQEIDVTGDAYKSHLILPEDGTIHVVTFSSFLSDGRQGQGYRDLIIQDDIFKVVGQDGLYGLIKIGSTQAKPQSFSVDAAYQSIANNATISALMAEGTTLQSLMTLDGISEYQAVTNEYGTITTTVKSSALPISENFLSADIALFPSSSQSYSVSSLTTNSATNEFNTSFEWGVLPGFIVPIKSSFWEEKQGSEPARKETFVKWKDDKESGYSDGSFEIEGKGGPKSFSKAKDLKNPSATWKWTTTYAAELSGKLKMKIGQPKMVDPASKAGSVVSPYELRKKKQKIIAEQNRILESEKSAFTKLYDETRQKIMRMNDPTKAEIDNIVSAGYDKLKEQTKIASEQLAKAKLVKAEQSSLDLGLSVAGAWKYEGYYVGISETLKQFKLDFGATTGIKVPIRNLGSIAAVYFILGAQIGFRWTQDYKSGEASYNSVNSQVDLDEILAAGLSMPDLIELVDTNGLSINKLTLVQQNALKPNDVRWRFRFSPTSLFPQSALTILQTTAKISQAAAEVMLYIPPTLFFTLASKLGGNDNKRVDANDMNAPSPKAASKPITTNYKTTILMSDMVGSSSSMQLYQRPNSDPTGFQLMEEASVALRNIMDVQVAATALDTETLNTFSGFLKLKEFGLQAVFSIPACDIDLKGFVGYDLSLGSQNGVFQGKFSAGIGVQATLKALFFSIPFNFYFTFFSTDFSDPTASFSNGFYGNQTVSTAYQNLMAAENFSPIISVINTPPPLALPLLKGTSGETFNPETKIISKYKLNSGRFPSLDSKIKNTVAVYVEPVQAGTSKTGLIVDAFLISGYTGSSGTTIWDTKSIKKVSRGLLSDIKIQGVNYNQKQQPYLPIETYLPVITFNGISESSTAAYQQALATTTQISGTVNMLSIAANKASIIGTWTTLEPNSASRFSQSISIVAGPNRQENYIASSMPSAEYNQGAVLLRSVNLPSQGGSALNLIYSSDPADQVAFGLSTDASESPNGDVATLTIALDGGSRKSIPVAYTILNPWQVINQGAIELASTSLASVKKVMSGLVTADRAPMRVRQVASLGYQIELGSTGRQWQAVSYIGSSLQLQTSVVQLSNINHTASSQLNYFFTQSSIDTALSTNDYFSGSIARYGAANSTANYLAVGATGSAYILDLSTVSPIVNPNENSSSPFIRLKGVDTAPIATFKVAFIYAGVELDLWLDFDTAQTGSDYNQLTKDQLVNAVLQSRTDTTALFGYNYASRLTTTNAISMIAIGDASISLVINGSDLFGEKASANLELNDIGYALANDSPNSRVNSFVIRSFTNNQPLSVKSIDSFDVKLQDNEKVKTSSPIGDWLCVSTDDSDGNSLLYLITDTARINQSLTSEVPTTLWLDKYSGLGPDEFSFDQGTTGIAFLHGSTLDTYLSQDGIRYLVIGDAATMVPGKGLDNTGRVFILKYDDKLIQYARTNSGPSKVPFIDPVKYLGLNPTQGAILNGDQANGLYGQQIAIYKDSWGHDVIAASQPGTLNAEALSNLQQNQSNTNLFYTPYNGNDYTTIELTSPGTVATNAYVYQNGDIIAESQRKRSLIFTTETNSINNNNVQNQNLYAFGLQNLNPEVTSIAKKFNGVITSISSSIAKNSQAGDSTQLDALVTDSSTGSNYIMTTKLTDRSFKSTNGQFDPLAVDWSRQLVSSTQSGAISERPNALQLNATNLISTLDLSTQAVMEGESLTAAISNLTGSEIKLNIRLEDISAYENKDYEPLELNLNLESGASQNQIIIKTIDSGDYRPARMFRVIVESYDMDGNKLGQSHVREVRINSNKVLDLATVGTGAALSANVNSALALSACSLPASQSKDHFATILSANIDPNSGLLVSPFLTILKHADKDYNLSKNTDYNKTYSLPTWLNPAAIQNLSFGSKQYLAVSGTNTQISVPTQESSVLLYDTTGDTQTLLSKSDNFFQSPDIQIVSTSPTFGSVIGEIKVNQDTYTAITDPAASSLYLIDNKTIGLLTKGTRIDIDNLVKDNTKKAFKITATNGGQGIAFGASFATGDLHGNQALAIGAPMANEGADASTAIYGGRVYLLNIQDIVSSTSHVIDISEKSQSSVRAIQIDGLTAVDKDPTSTTYLQGYGPALGASLAFANIVDLKDKGKSQLLIGAPQYTAGSEETGAIFVLDPTSTALQFEAVKTKTIPFNSLYFATGLQDQSLTGMTFIGDSGDMIGTSIINLKQFTGGKDGADNTDKDVISIAAPARFDGAGGVYVYIGNNNKHLALEQLNPSSIYQHSFQYVGTVAGEDLANGIGPLIQAGVNTNSIGQFSKPLSADYPQGNDLVVSVNNSITPGAIMVYGKPYLYPGNTTSIFDVSAGGFAKPIVGSGLPVPIGDANLDGFDDYVLYQQSLNGRNQDSRPVQSTLVYGNGPTVLTAYPEAKFSTAIASTWQLQENLAFGPIRQTANITAQPISATSLQHTSALFAGGSKLNAIARSAYLGYQSSPISDTNYAYGSGAIATGRFLQSDPYREVMVQYRYNGNPVDKPLINISINRLDSAISSNVNIPFDSSNQRLTSLTTTTNLTQKQGGESSFLLGIVRRRTDGIAEFAIQRFSMLSEKQASMPEDVFKASSSSFKYDDNVRFMITSQFIFNGSTYATIAKTSSPANNQSRYCELSIVNLSTGHEQAIATIATPAGANSELIAWFDNLSPAALISALDDWNGDGLPDISFTGLSSTRVSGQNPFINTVLFGGLANSSTASVWQRYSLFWSNQDSQSIRPLALQAPIQLLSLGDTTGSGSASLLAAPLPSNGLNEKVSSQFSFELFPSEYSGANTQKINGSEGSDYLIIDGSVPYGKLDKGLIVIDLEQGDDDLQILKQAVTNPLSLRPLVFVSGGSGNDTVSVDGYLLQGDFSSSGKGAPVDLVYNGGSGFNALRVLAGGNLSAPIDITRLLNNAVGLSEIVFQQDLFIDCSRLHLPQGHNFENASGIFITAPYGTTISLINAQTFVAGDMTVRNGLNYVQYSDYVSGYSFFVQQGITLNMPGVAFSKLTVLPYSPSSGVAPFNTTFRTPSGDLQGDVVFKRLDAAPQVNIQNKNLDIGQTGIDFSLNLDPAKPGDTARAIVELDPLLDGLELTSGGVKKRLAYFAYGTIFGEDAPVATPFTYDPVQKAGARFYDLDGNGSADIADLQFVDGGYGDKDGLKNGVVVDPSTAGAVDLNAIFTATATSLTVSDPTDSSSPAALVVRASLSSRSSSVNQIGYVALNANETLSLSYDLVKERGTLLFGTLSNNDVPDISKMKFQRDINLINGQKLIFFEVVDNTLEALLKSGSLDSSFRTLDVTKMTDSSATAGKGGSILDLFLGNDVSGLGELISSQMGEAPVFDFSSLSGQTLTGDVLIAREASYDSTIGFYKLERSDGAVRDSLTNSLILPGEAGYAAAALRSTNLFSGFGSLATSNRTNKSADLESFKDVGLLAPFARVANTGETYFSFAAANSDGLSHFRVLGSGVLGLEDIKGGGDRDFDDLIVAFNFRLGTGTLA